MQTGIHIGAVYSEDSLVGLTNALVRLMEAKADQKTIRAAIAILHRAAGVEGVTISDCSVTGDTHVAAPKPVEAYDDVNDDD